MLLSVSVRDGGREGSDGVYASGWTGLGSWDCGIMGIPRFAPGNIYGREGCLGKEEQRFISLVTTELSSRAFLPSPFLMRLSLSFLINS